MGLANPSTDRSRGAREDRTRMRLAVRDLEQALAMASFDREDAWTQRLIDSLGALQTALRETGASANSEGSMLGGLFKSSPGYRVGPTDYARITTSYRSRSRKYV